MSKNIKGDETFKAAIRLQLIELAKKAFIQINFKKDTYNAFLSAVFLGDAYRKAGDYNLSSHYDLIAILHSLRGQDIRLKQKAIINYILNFIEGYNWLIPKVYLRETYHFLLVITQSKHA